MGRGANAGSIERKEGRNGHAKPLIKAQQGEYNAELEMCQCLNGYVRSASRAPFNRRHCEPQAKQSITGRPGLLRRFAPRNDSGLGGAPGDADILSSMYI